jgi:WD40 repeat protein
VFAVAFSPDGTRVATGSGVHGRGDARVFDAATGTEISRLDHDAAISVVAFSPDGTRVATGSRDPSSRDRSARVFDAATGTEMSRLDHDDAVTAVAFSPDGTRVATGSDDGSARVWCTDHGQLIEQAVGRLTRNLTQQEWRHYFRDEPYRKTRSNLP